MKHVTVRALSLFLMLATLASTVLFAVSCDFDFGDPASGTVSGGETGGGNGEDGPVTVVPSAVVINEVCTKNLRNIHEEDDTYCDWIELYNKSDEDVSLAGWGVSDRAKKVKHIFAAGVTVPAKGFLILWACGPETSSDKDRGISLPFGLSKNGENLYLFNAAGAVADYVAVPAIQEGSSFGRTEDGGDAFCEFVSASIGGTNGKSDIRYLDDSVMRFSHESGFYGEAFDLRVGVPEGYTLYYTDDSTTPTENSAEYPAAGIRVRDKSDAPNKYSCLDMGTMEQCYEGYSKVYGHTTDPVDKCTVLRFLLVSDEGYTSRVVTKSFFIGSRFLSETGGYKNMSVVSLVGDPADFFGDENGNEQALFTNQEYWKKTDTVEERAANFAYFGADKQYSFDQDIGVRLHGTSTRGYNQKSMTLFARRKYGAGKFKKSILGVSDVGSLVLRTDGTTKLQEGFLQSFVSDRAVSTSNYEPTVVFIDGEYYGVFNLMERFSEDYVEAHYGVSGDNVYIVKKGEATTRNAAGFWVDAGEGNVPAAMDSYVKTFRNLLNADLSVAKNWQALVDAVDLQSLVDYLAIQIILGNMDWSFAQNIAVWRTADPSSEDSSNPYADGKWRFVLYDLDFAAGCWNAVANWKGRVVTNYNASTNSFTAAMPFAGAGVSSMSQMQNLMKNKTFVEKFVLAFEDLCNVNFAPDRAVAMTEAAIARIQSAMPKHFKRFGVPVKAYQAGSVEGKDDTFWKVKTYFGGYSVYPATVSAAKWAEEMQFLVDFFRDRSSYALGHMASFCGVPGSTVGVTLVSAGAAGTVVLNGATAVTLDKDGSFTGNYYTAYPITVTAVAPEGYVFCGWTVSGATLSTATGETTRLTLTNNCTLTANFAPQ